MIWCSHCCENRETAQKPHQEYVCCHCCGKVLEYPVCSGPRLFGKMINSRVSRYLLNEAERSLKKIIWEKMNKEYLEEQAVKESVFAQELVSVTSAAMTKSRKDKKRKNSADYKNAASKRPCGETSCELKQKSFSSKINYKVLESLYEDNPKNQETASESKEGDDGDINAIEEKLNESDEAARENGEDLGIVEGDENDYHYNSEDQGYDKDDDNDYFGGGDEEYGHYDEWDE